MYVVVANPTFTHTVNVLVPSDGGHDKQTLRATFRVLPSDKESEFDISTIEGSNGFLRAIIVELLDLVDAKEQPVPYSDKLRDQLFALPFIRTALVKTYFDAIRKAAEGN
jgi:hypothetical protein